MFSLELIYFNWPLIFHRIRCSSRITQNNLDSEKKSKILFQAKKDQKSFSPRKENIELPFLYHKNITFSLPRSQRTNCQDTIHWKKYYAIFIGWFKDNTLLRFLCFCFFTKVEKNRDFLRGESIYTLIFWLAITYVLVMTHYYIFKCMISLKCLDERKTKRTNHAPHIDYEHFPTWRG